MPETRVGGKPAVNALDILPAYSFATLAFLQQLQEHGMYKETIFSNLKVEQSMLNVIEPYLLNDYKMDTYTFEVLNWVAQNKSFHALLRLSAFAALNKGQGLEQTMKSTGINKKKWKKLYAKMGERLMLSPVRKPYRGGVAAYIDYYADHKEDVSLLVEAVELSRKEVGLKQIAIVSRDTAKHKRLDHKSVESQTEFGAHLLGARHRGSRPKQVATQTAQVFAFPTVKKSCELMFSY